MIKKSFVGLTLISLTVAACTSKSPPSQVDLESKLKSGKKIASQNGVTINEGYLELLKQVNPNLEAQLKSPIGKKRLVDSLLEQELFYRESLKKGVQNNPKYLEKAALYQRVIISQGLLEEEVELRAKEYYDKNKEEEFSQVGVAHILFRIQKPNPANKEDKGITEQDALAKAQEAKAKLDQGAQWEIVVNEYTDDKLTQPRAGDLGKISKDDRRIQRLQWQALVDKAFEMKMGDISDPIKAQDGYHIIKITEVAAVAPYPEVENRIKFKLRSQVKEEIMKNLGGGKVEYEDEELIKISEPGVPGMMPGAPGAPGGPGPSANRPITKPQIPTNQLQKQPQTPPGPPPAPGPIPAAPVTKPAN